MGINGSNAHLITNKEEAIASATALTRDSITPVLTISSVNGDGYDLLKCFLNVLPPIGFTPMERQKLSQKSPFFQIEEVFRVPRVGIVVCGLLTEGVLCVGNRMKIGPTASGSYQLARVGSIRRNKQPVFSILPGEAASIAVTFDVETVAINRGMVMISEVEPGASCVEFVAKLFLFYHPGNDLEIGFQGTGRLLEKYHYKVINRQFLVYIGSLRKTAVITDILSDDKKVHPGRYTTVKYSFVGKPEFVQNGAPLIFRESKTRGMGEVSSIIPINTTNGQ